MNPVLPITKWPPGRYVPAQSHGTPDAFRERMKAYAALVKPESRVAPIRKVKP